jgi:hypothetical protein
MSAVEETTGFVPAEESRLPPSQSIADGSAANSKTNTSDNGMDDNVIDSNKILSGNHNGTEEESAILECTDDPVAAAAVVARAAAQVGVDMAVSSRKKRLCRFPGCPKVIKSQGHCQRHGAKTKRCKVEGCDKQAQGTHEGMCKRHWRAFNFPESAHALKVTAEEAAKETEPPPPSGVSVYESILPASIAYRPNASAPIVASNVVVAAAASAGKKASTSTSNSPDGRASASATASPSTAIMPLIAHLRQGALNEQVGWHRNAERRARGMFPVASLSTQLEPWERQLTLVEILLLSGGTPNANFKDLAHAWGREKGFHQVLASSICERRGEVERKRRSDAGKVFSPQQLENRRKKVEKTKESRTTQGEAVAATENPPESDFVFVEGGDDGNRHAPSTVDMEEASDVSDRVITF